VAERSASSKEALAKQVIQGIQGMPIKHRLANFLLRYRTTPHNTTGVSPGELMMKRCLRTRLSLVKPNLAQVVESKQERQKGYKDGKRKSEITFEKDERVRVLNTRAGKRTNKWSLGSVVKVCGPRTYVVKFGNTMRKVHADHIIRAYDMVENDSNEVEGEDEESKVSVEESREQAEADDNLEMPSEIQVSELEKGVGQNLTPMVPSKVGVTDLKVVRRSGRIRKPVDRFGW
jgi:hypothetical protein